MLNAHRVYWVCKVTDAVKRPPNLSVLVFFIGHNRSLNKTNSPSPSLYDAISLGCN